MESKGDDQINSTVDPVATAKGNAPHFHVPNLLFDNHTTLDATQFDVVDQHGSPFHVVVAKTSFSIGLPDTNGIAMLAVSNNSARLSATDIYRGDTPAFGLLKESDLAPYKPSCDVILNATACAPGGKAIRTFNVRLMVEQMSASAHLKDGTEVLIDKTLQVSGEREFRERGWFTRKFNWFFTVVSLGLWRPVPWRLTAPERFTDLPLAYEFAFGGECRLSSDDAVERNVPRQAQLEHGKEQDVAQTSDQVIAHEACEANPIGRGFARHWYLRAKRVTRISAPRVTYPAQPCTARAFWRGAGGENLPAPAGFGAIERGWLPRRALAGKFEEKVAWDEDEVPKLPSDFDFAYWNCAPLDQQCKYLNGTAKITLVNLCRPDHPSATVNRGGDTLLRIQLPRHALFLLCADQEKKFMVTHLEVDTVFVDPAAGQLELVWRICLPADGDIKEVRLIQATEPAQLERLRLIEEAQGVSTEHGDSSDTPATKAANSD